jgi:hypothetical protein
MAAYRVLPALHAPSATSASTMCDKGTQYALQDLSHRLLPARWCGVLGCVKKGFGYGCWGFVILEVIVGLALGVMS